MPGYISPEALDRLIRKGREQSFLLVDVRPPSAYALDHIPGAVNLPAPEIDDHTFDVDAWDNLIFYCRNGIRSKVAACIAEENGFPGDRVFNLSGGINAYAGEILLDMPVLSVFQEEMSLADLMEKAVNLEKGACRFYREITPLFEGTPAHDYLSGMENTEIAHARTIFNTLAPLVEDPRSFDAVFEACKGDLLEGGRSTAEALSLMTDSCGNRREAILDFALDMEFSAYDLYKNRGAGRAGAAGDLFIALAQAEKTHIADILKCIDIIATDTDRRRDYSSN
jgi:rhodanese-related sulfurtransferase/rubrerythrin